MCMALLVQDPSKQDGALDSMRNTEALAMSSSWPCNELQSHYRSLLTLLRHDCQKPAGGYPCCLKAHSNLQHFHIVLADHN